MPIDLEELAIKSIDQYARVETKLGSIESTIQYIRSDNAKMLNDFNESLRVITDIQRQLLNNTNDHSVLHQRVDDVKEELDEIREGVQLIKTTCATNGQYRNQMQHLEELIKQLEFAAKVFSYRVFGLPAWAIFVAIVTMGFIIDVIKHRDIVLVITGLFK